MKTARWSRASGLSEPGDERSVTEWIAALEDPELRAEAATALGKLGDPRAVQPLIVHLDDGQVQVQLAAARALGQIGDNRATDPLLWIARDPNRNVGVRRVALKALERLGLVVDRDASRPSFLWYWIAGLVLMVGGLILAGTAGALAIIPFVAGLTLLLTYFVREARRGRRGGYSLSDDAGGTEFVFLGPGDDGGDGGWGDGGGGGNGGGDG